MTELLPFVGVIVCALIAVVGLRVLIDLWREGPEMVRSERLKPHGLSMWVRDGIIHFDAGEPRQ